MNKKLLITTSVICALPLIFAAAVYSQLPETMAIHWDMEGNANGFMPKFYAAFGLPFFLLVLHIVGVTVTTHDPKRKNQAGIMRLFTYWIIPIISLIVNPMTLFTALGRDINIGSTVTTLVGLLLIICGNYLPKSRQNYTIGIKLPWTLASTDNWNKTHRLAGILFMICGAAILASPFIPGNKAIFLIVVIAVVAVVPAVYSFLLYIRESKTE